MPSSLVTLGPRLDSLVAFSNISWFYVIQSKKYLGFLPCRSIKVKDSNVWCLPAVLHIRELDQLFVLLWGLFFFFHAFKSGDNCLYWGALVKWKIMLIRKTFIPIRWGLTQLCAVRSLPSLQALFKPDLCRVMRWFALYSSSQAFPKLLFGVFHKD